MRFRSYEEAGSLIGSGMTEGESLGRDQVVKQNLNILALLGD